MELTYLYDDLSGEHRMTLVLTALDQYEMVVQSDVERFLMRHFTRDDATVSDRLQAASMIAEAIEKGQAKRRKRDED